MLASAVVFVAVGASAAASPTAVYRGVDWDPQWSPDGSQIAFRRQEAYQHRLLAIGAGGGSEKELAAGENAHFVLSPDWRWIAVVQEDRLSVLGRGDTEPIFVARSPYLLAPVWLPDSRRLVFPNGRAALPYSEYDTVSRRLRDVAGFPSPTHADRFVALRCSTAACDVVVSDADGGAPVVVASVRGDIAPTSGAAAVVWSPDGRRIAFGARLGSAWALGVVMADGSGLRTYATGFEHGRTMTWEPGAEAVTLEGTYVVDLRSGAVTRIVEGAQPAWSPDGTRLAFVADRECGGKGGIHVLNVARQTVSRLTNNCRLLGTPGPDFLTGTDDRELLFGFGGDDVLRADATNEGYSRDTVYGGDGADRLLGGVGADDLFGEGGDDTIKGGYGPDVISGGSGRDLIEANQGRHTIFARDGLRDRISCGPNAETNPRRNPDVVYADRLDVVASDCERVFRR